MQLRGAARRYSLSTLRDQRCVRMMRCVEQLLLAGVALEVVDNLALLRF
jgi:hypothetical protein